MNYRTATKKMKALIENAHENADFDEHNCIFLGGCEFKKGDFKNLLAYLDRCEEVFKSRSKASQTYLNKNRDYHYLMKKICYYKRKPLKKPKDYAMIEKYSEELNELRRKRNMVAGSGNKKKDVVIYVKHDREYDAK